MPTPRPRSTWWLLSAVGLLGYVLVGCASSPPVSGFTKVKYYHLKEEDWASESRSIDPMIRFERNHLLYGAVTEEETEERLGHYYTLFWNGPSRRTPVTVRFQYRQARTGERVFAFDHTVKDVRDKNQTRLSITGAPYHRHGRVVSWQATLLQDGQVIDQTRSFLWK